jgi:hypothetical protein
MKQQQNIGSITKLEAILYMKKIADQTLPRSNSLPIKSRKISTLQAFNPPIPIA